MIQTVWHTLVRLVVNGFIGSRLYKLKSLIYRGIFERQYKHVPLKPFSDFRTLANYIKPKAWRADSWKELFDAVSYPGKAEMVFSGKESPTSGFDCDEFAIYLTAVLQDKGALMMSCIWAEGWKPNGHNVCVFPGLGGFFFMDYGMPVGPFASEKAVLQEVTHKYSNGKGTPLCGVTQRLDLTPVKFV